MTLDSEKIIHILLKHLMVLKNENAFLKNNAALNQSEDETSGDKIGGKDLPDGTSKNMYGGKDLLDGTSKNMYGGNDLPDGTSKNMYGGINLSDGTSKNMYGGKDLPDGTSKNIYGGKDLPDGTSKNMYGGKDLPDGTSKNMYGGKDFMDLDAIINGDANESLLIYSVFEKELIKALEYYIKNGEGKNTVYTFYTEFVEAIEERNLAVSKQKDAAANARLEDTHSLPLKINTDAISFAKLQDALQGSLPHRARWSMYEKVAHELLLLHNAEKATSSQLRGFGGLSPTGFEKHLTKLLQYDLIKKLPPSNYVLTDKSNHILLELFGIPKTK